MHTLFLLYEIYEIQKWLAPIAVGETVQLETAGTAVGKWTLTQTYPRAGRKMYLAPN